MQEFFASVRTQFGPLSQPQVDGFNALLSETLGMKTPHRAYVLATAWHETARKMQPIAEIGKGKGKPYGKPDSTGKAPYGRGYVQLTWRDNYAKADQKLGLGGALAKDYDLAMRADIAAKVIVRGMAEGWFTGKKLDDYTGYVGMRHIVNGTDRANMIAGYAEKFETALRAAATATDARITPTPPPGTAPNPPAPQAQQPRGLLQALLALLAALFTKKG
jgi:predicted chitinase